MNRIMPPAIAPICLILAAASVMAAPVVAQSVPAADRLAGYADAADLALASPVIVRATLTRAPPLAKNAAAGSAAPGRVRLMVTAQVTNLLVAPGAMAGTLAWLWDAPAGAKGRPPAAKGMDVLAFLAPPGSDGGTRLISRRGQQPWDPALAETVRQIVAEARSGNVPVVRGVEGGFRADGTIPGESESQFFLTTADGKPATLVVQNRPGEARKILVARGDIIDESARPVQRSTLLWYRLACFLPAALPAAAGGDDAALARDWRDALASLGPCGRSN
jgi:hypothetical protein